MKGNFAKNNNMKQKNGSIQLTRICITTTPPVGEKSIFFQKSLQGRFPTRLFLYCTHMSIAKLQKNPLYCHSHPGLAVRHMCLTDRFQSYRIAPHVKEKLLSSTHADSKSRFAGR